MVGSQNSGPWKASSRVMYGRVRESVSGSRNSTQGVFTWYRRDFHSGARCKVAPCKAVFIGVRILQCRKIDENFNEYERDSQTAFTWHRNEFSCRDENLAPAQEPGWTRAGMKVVPVSCNHHLTLIKLMQKWQTLGRIRPFLLQDQLTPEGQGTRSV